jgi:cellulose synthase operon protein C
MEKSYMTRSVVFRSQLSFLLLAAALFSGCSPNPNVRKQKYFDSGEKYFAQGKYREAAIQYSNAIRVDPRFAQAHYQLSQAYLRLGDGSRAFQELTRTVDLAPDNYRAHTDLANLFSLPGRDGSPIPDNLKQAKIHLDLLRDKVPNNPETHEAWANYYSVQKNFTAAIQEMEQAINLNPNRSESYVQLGYLQESALLTDDAERSFKSAAQVDPRSATAQLALGGFDQLHGRMPEAEQQYRRVLQLEPENPVPRASLVRLLMTQGRNKEAEQVALQAKKDIPDNPETYRMPGDFYFAIGDMDKAIAEYAAIFKDHPKDLQTKKNYIQLLILKDRLEEATKLNEEILKSSHSDVEGLIYKGQVELRQNDAAGAIQSLQAAIGNDPENAVAHYQLGLAYAQQDDLGRAEQEWREAVRIRPDLTDAQRSLASVELSRNEVGAVMLTAQEIIKTEPFSADGFLLKAAAELASRQYAPAQQDAEEAAKRAPESPTPYVQMGTVQLAQDHYSEAEKLYQQALEKDPSSGDGLSGLMNTYFVQKEFDKAIVAANAQIARSPNTSNFYDLLGTALFNGKKDYPGAEAALRKAVELDKNNVDAIDKLGKVQVQEGSADRALALYQQSIKDKPREVSFYLLSGELYEAKQDWEHAKAMYQQALSISPDNPLASNNLAYLLLNEGGNVDVAMSMAETARRRMPDSSNVADTLGWAYYKKGVYQSAISQFQEALKLNEKIGAPDDPQIHYHLGLAYEKANQLGLARQQLEKAVKLSPDYGDARKALSGLRS